MVFWLKKSWSLAVGLLIMVIVISSCAGEKNDEANRELESSSSSGERTLTMPELEPLGLDDRPLQVIATTSIIGDVVAQVGGDEIELLTLINPGQDPHSFEPSAGELTAVSKGDVIFVNGWNLEEGLADDLSNIDSETPVIPVGANIDPLEFAGNSDSDHEDEVARDERSRIDPHTWFAVSNVQQWVRNITAALSELDPANAANYESNGQAYTTVLQELDMTLRRQIENIPVEKRIMITSHNSFGYFAKEYGFKVVGTIMPTSSTLAEPSASDLAELIRLMEQEGICTIFTETTVSDTLPQTVAQELSKCEQVKIVSLFSGSIGLPGSGADSYQGMMEANVANIVEGLQ